MDAINLQFLHNCPDGPSSGFLVLIENIKHVPITRDVQ